MGNTVAKVGMVVGKAPTTAAGTTTGYTINAIDSSHDEYDILTLSADAGKLELTDILVEVTQAGASAKSRLFQMLFCLMMLTPFLVPLSILSMVHGW